MGTVNMVFHGTFAFLNWGATVEVLVPSVESHVYKYGDVYSLKDLTPGYTYTLSNVTPAADSPEEKELGIAIVVTTDKSIKINRSSEVVVCSILMPAPKRFAGVQWFAPFDKNGKRVTSPPIFEGGNASTSTKEMTSYAGIHVLTYDSANLEAVRLTGSDWTPTVKDGVVNIHLFAEPQARMNGAQHRSNAFASLMTVFYTPDLSISTPIQDDKFGEVFDGPVISGLTKNECLDLPAFVIASAGGNPRDADAGGDPAGCASGGWDQGGGS